MYKNILIIGEVFSNQGGGPITLSNLFWGWPKENLFVAALGYQINQRKNNICENYYCLGKDERKIRFPLSLIKKQYKSGKVKFNGNIKNISYKYLDDNLKLNKYKSIFKPYITRFVEKGLFYMGLYFLCIRLKPSDQFKKWINEIQPDIIYCQPQSLDSIIFIEEILKLHQFKLVIHFTDDYPMTLNKSVLFKEYWDKVIAAKLNLLLNKADLLLSTSEGMSIEYLQRYNKEFIPFHNPVDFQKWLPFKKESWEVENNFSILYTGRIGFPNSTSLVTICEVIDEINKVYNNIRLDLFSPDYNSVDALSIMKYSGVIVNKPISHEDMPKLLASYDMLVLPLDFSKDGIKFARLSMPTKASEYMISGIPILIFASEETEIVRHAKIHKWAYCATKNDNNLLKSIILKFYNDINLRKKYGKTAHEYALNNYNADKIRNRFKDLICNI